MREITDPAVSRFPIPQDLSALPDDLRQRIEAVQEKTGFVPNVFLTLGHRPDELRAFMDYHDALMRREGGLTKAEKEMIVVATSAHNHCLYCVVAHGAILRIYAKAPHLADQLSINAERADITERQKAMLRFALEIADGGEDLDEDDFDDLEAHGFSREDIWDIGAIAAFFAMSNRLANLTAMAPNAQFYAMGR